MTNSLWNGRVCHSTANNGDQLQNSFIAQNKPIYTFPTDKSAMKTTPTSAENILRPSSAEIDRYIARWKEPGKDNDLEQTVVEAFRLYPQNVDIRQILTKVTVLNTIYSTNIFAVYPVAKRIKDLNVDKCLASGDLKLVERIRKIQIGDGVERDFYSFATKYCSHHRPDVYPIYDRFVDGMLRLFRNRDKFSKFHNEDLRKYDQFCRILSDFKTFYKLPDYIPKELDIYLWQKGKEVFSQTRDTTTQN